MVSFSTTSLDLPTFKFDFDLDEIDLQPVQETILYTEYSENSEDRSPRTPTYQGENSPHSGSISPFNPDRFFTFPILAPPSELSPLKSQANTSVTKPHMITCPSSSAIKENIPIIIPTMIQPPPPNTPFLWIWTCHLCRSKYPLGATRRCLVDGHLYCSGDNNSSVAQRNVKRKKKHSQSCSSEFDYVGWHQWGTWKRENIPSKLKGCEGCEYPSECRYLRANKIPEVVTALSLKKKKKKTIKIDRGVEIEAAEKQAEQDHKVTLQSTGTNASQSDRQQSLKIDTGCGVVLSRKSSKIASRRHSDAASNRSQSPQPRNHSQESGVCPSTSPISPDLVDFAAMIIEPDRRGSGVCAEMSTEPGTKSTLIVDDKDTDKAATPMEKSQRVVTCEPSKSEMTQNRIRNLLKLNR